MKIILKENIENLGRRGDIIDVAAGYGRNYLIPRKLAIQVTPANMKLVEMEQKALRKKLEQEVKSFQSVIEQINQTSLVFERKAGDKDVIFGSVSTTDIKEALDKQGLEVEKKKILLAEPIKRLGNFTVPVKVFHDDRAEIKIEVIKEGGEEEKMKPVASEEQGVEGKKAEKEEAESEKGPIDAEPEKAEEPAEEIEAAPETEQETPGEQPEKEEPEAKPTAESEEKPEESSEEKAEEKKDE